MKSKGLLLAIIATFLWGTHSVLGRYLAGSLPVELISVSRLLIGALSLLCLLLFRVFTGSETIEVLKLRRNDVQPLVVSSVCVGINLFLFHWGLKFTTANNAMVLESTAPIFVALLAPLFLLERISKRDISLSLVAFFGILLVVYSNNAGTFSIFGDSIELLAGLTWALFILLSKKLNSDSTSLTQRLKNLMYVLFGAGLLLLAFTVLNTELTVKRNWLLPLLYLGVFPTAIAYSCWYEAGTLLKPTLLAILFNLSVVFTTLNAYLFLGEKLSLLSCLGISIILGAITWMALKNDNGTDPALATEGH
ncbi:MAG: DMT family transporter [Reinekea sp.]